MTRDRGLLAFFGLAYGISWLVWAPLWLSAVGVQTAAALPYQHALGAIGPIAAAFIVTARETGRAGVRGLLRRMVLWRGRLAWVAVAGLAPFVLAGAALFATSIVEGPLSLTGLGRSREFPELSAFMFFAYNLLSFGYGEEVGWRGFALPRLQARYSSLVATVVLTLGWAVWHWPLFLYRPGYTSMGLGGTIGWLASLFFGGVLFTWLYNGSRGSLLVVALFHATMDVMFTSDLASPLAVNATGVLVVLSGILVLIGSRDGSRAPTAIDASIADTGT
jgi:uncharacterized protein